MKKGELNRGGDAQLSVKVRPIHQLESIKDIKTQLHNLISQHTPVTEADHEPTIPRMQGNAEVMQFLAELNEEAVQLINADSYDEALHALSQAEEKISTLDKIEPNEETYIITVFYNIACCHQKLGELQKCNAYLKLTIQLLKKLFVKRSDRPKVNKRRRLTEHLMRLKYSTKFNLQLWAILSQLNEHDEALQDAINASEFCQESLKCSHDLCLEILKDRQADDRYEPKSNKLGKRKISKSENRQTSLQDKPYEQRLKKTMKSAYKEMNPKRLARQDKFYAKNNNGSFTTIKKNRLDITRESKSEDNRSRHSSISSSTSLIIRESADSEILEQIHTFNLKRSSMALNTIKEPEYSSFTKRRGSTNSAHRAFYVSELVKIQDSEMERTMNVLKEMIRQVEDFNKVREMKTEKRIEYLQQRLGEKKRLKISFSDKEEIERMKVDNQFKLNVRSALGIKNPDDWIFNLNIGNVMHMSPIGFDDLHSSLNLDSIEKRCVYELSKDSLLEKIVLLTVGYFWVGTELRFLMANSKNTKNYQKDSEMWHAKALHTASTFLPADCPLVSHVMGSYLKHHLKPKLEERKLVHDRIQENINKTMIINKEDDEMVPDERPKDEFKKLRHLFKGHKISEPNFGDKVKSTISKSSKKSLNHSCEKNSKKKQKKLGVPVDNKSYKGTPKKWIDFTAYLNSSKKNSRNNFQYITKNDISKSNSAIHPMSTKHKKQAWLAKQKESMDKILNKYDFRTNNIIKQFKQHKVDAKTPRVSDRVLNVKSTSHKKSNANIHSHTNKLYGISNSSFSTDPPEKQIADVCGRKKSSSSSPDIRSTPNNIWIGKKPSNQDFGYVNPKRKSYNNWGNVKTLYEKKHNIPQKYTKPNLNTGPLGSGRSSVMSNLSKTATKYRNTKQSSISFIEALAKREYTNTSIDLIHSGQYKHAPITPINEENYRSMLTRNIPRGVKEEKSAENASKECLKKKQALGITCSVSYNTKAIDKALCQKYVSAKKPQVKKKEKNNSSTRKQPRQILLSGKLSNLGGNSGYSKHL